MRERDTGTPVNAAGWANGCRTSSGAAANETMQVSDATKAWLLPTVTIKTADPVQPSFVFTAGDIDFRDPKSPFNASALVVRAYSFVNLEITSVEKPPIAPEVPAPSIVEVTAKTKAGKSFLLGRVMPASFSRDGIVNIRFPVDGSFTDFQPLLEISGRLRRAAATDLVAKQTLVVKATGGDEKIRIVYGDQVAEIRPVLRSILIDAGLTAAQADRVANVPVIMTAEALPSGARWEDDPRILVTSNFVSSNPDHADGLMHEWAHQLFHVLQCQATIDNPYHAGVRLPASSRQLAWDEGMMHLLGSHLLNRALRQRGIKTMLYSNGSDWRDDDLDQNRALVLQWRGKNSPNTNVRMDTAGNWIEALPAGVFLEWYGQDFYKTRGIGDSETDAIPVLRQILTDLRGYFAVNTDAGTWTLEGFFLHLRPTLPPEMRRKVDQTLLWYNTADRAGIQGIERIDRLIPAVLTSAVPAGAAPKIGDTVSVKVSARVIRRLIGDYRNYGGSSVKIRLYEGSTQLGNEISFGGANPDAGYDAAALFQPAFTTDGTHKLKAEIWGDLIDGTMEKLGETAELSIDIPKGPTDLSAAAKAKYQWLKDALPYLQELLELDQRTFRLLEKEVDKQIRGRLTSNPPSPLSEGDRNRLSELDAEFGKATMTWKPVMDPLTGKEEYHFVQEGNLSPGNVARAKEWGELKARADSEFAFTHYTQQCIHGETEKHLQRQREIRNKISTLEDSTPYKNFQEYANLNDYGGYLKAVETLNKQLNLPTPIPRPATLPWTYAAPCAAVSAPASNAPRVTLKITPNPVNPNVPASVNATVTGGKPPFKFTWTGDVKGQDANATFTGQKAGEYPVQVTVTDAGGNTASADARVRVSAVQVRLDLTPPVPKIAFGETRSVKAVLTSEGQAVPGSFVYRWENKQDVRFSEDETRTAQTNVTFLKPGRQTLWVTVLTEASGTLSTVSESEPVEVEVAAPPMSIVFTPSAPLIGQETKATLNLPPTLPKDAIDFRWLLPGNAKILMESPDSREITFLPQSDQPVTFTVTAREPVVGTEFGKATATLTAKAFNVNAIVLGPSGSVSPDLALVNKPGSIAVGQDMKVRASISPVPAKPPVKFLWTVNQDGANQITSSNTGPEITVSRSSTGVCEISVEAFDANNTRLGKAATSFNVTISAAEIERAKKVKLSKEKIAEAKLIIRKGQLEEAIRLAEEAAALDQQNQEAATLAKRWKQEKARVLEQIEKTRVLVDQQKFVDGANELVVAKNLHNLYPPVLEFEKEFNEKWRDYDWGVRDGMGNIRMALENRQFKKAMQMAVEFRAKYNLIKITERDLQTYEQEAQRGEAEKERQRVLLKRGEEKYRNYDFAGAYTDLNVMFENNDFYRYWNSNYDPEPPYYQKLKDDAYLKNKRINELMSNVRNVAGDPSFAVPIVEKAISDCDEVLRIQPPNAEASKLRDTLSQRIRKTAAAAQVQTLRKQGEQLLDSKKYAEAAGVYTQIINLDPANADAYQKRASAKRYLKDLTGSLPDYNKAIELNPQNHLSWTGRGMAKSALGDKAGAIADFDNAIRINPNYALAYNERGLIEYRDRDWQNALKDFAKAAQLEPASAVYLNNRGAAKEQLGDLQGSLPDFERSLQLDPNYQLAKDNYARVKKLIAAQAPVSVPPVTSRFYTVDLTPVGGKRGSPRTAKEIEIDDASWIRMKSTDENRRQIDITLPSPVSASSVAIVTNLDDATYLEQGATIARITIITTEGAESAEIKAGVQTSEWNYRAVNPKHLWVERNHIGDNRFLARIMLPRELQVIGIRFDYVETNAPKWAGHAPGFVLRGVTLISGAGEAAEVKPSDAPIVTPGKETEVLNTGNIYGVQNSPTAAARFTLVQPHQITYVFTYHWNGARGSAAGTVSLVKEDGRVFGPWRVSTSAGQGGAPNVNWEARPNVVIPAGTYTVVDSDPATWSQNAQSGGRGMTIVKGIPAADTGIKLPPVKQTPPPTTQTPPKQSGTFVTAIFENRSKESIHIFPDGDTFEPANRLAPGEKREVRVRMTADGRIKFIAGRNGTVLTTKFWTGDPDQTNRFPHVIFDGAGLVVTTGLR